MKILAVCSPHALVGVWTSSLVRLTCFYSIPSPIEIMQIRLQILKFLKVIFVHDDVSIEMILFERLWYYYDHVERFAT